MINGAEHTAKYAGVFDRGISNFILKSLTSTFTGLDIFSSDKSLREFIIKECPNLSPWKNRISEAYSTGDRALYLINLLSKANHVEHGNALLIFLRYLEEKKGCDFADIWKAIST